MFGFKIQTLQKKKHLIIKYLIKIIIKSNLTGQTLNLFLNNHEFESSQNHWKLIYSLILEPVRLVEVRINWSGYPC
jgi:hypothetical protein